MGAVSFLFCERMHFLTPPHTNENWQQNPSFRGARPLFLLLDKVDTLWVSAKSDWHAFLKRWRPCENEKTAAWTRNKVFSIEHAQRHISGWIIERIKSCLCLFGP